MSTYWINKQKQENEEFRVHTLNTVNCFCFVLLLIFLSCFVCLFMQPSRVQISTARETNLVKNLLNSLPKRSIMFGLQVCRYWYASTEHTQTDLTVGWKNCKPSAKKTWYLDDDDEFLILVATTGIVWRKETFPSFFFFVSFWHLVGLIFVNFRSKNC